MFSCNVPPALLAEQPGSFLFYCGSVIKMGGMDTKNKSQHRKLTLEKKNPPLLLPGLKPVTFQPRVVYSTTELSPLPQ